MTFAYAFITVPLKLIFALFIAYILNYNLKGIKLFRTIYYVPSILGGSVAISVLWIALFKNEELLMSSSNGLGLKVKLACLNLTCTLGRLDPAYLAIWFFHGHFPGCFKECSC